MANAPKVDATTRAANILSDGEITKPEAVELFQILQQEKAQLQSEQEAGSWDFYRTGDVRNPSLFKAVNS